MDLPRIPDIAARQSVDSTRVFREFVRVRRELESVEGSVFWKKVGEYEYMVHKVRGTTEYKGVRSPTTELAFAEFVAKKLRLKARHKLLKESVLTSQRMNKAVHVGTVPTEIIELLTLLEEHGLSESSLIMGAPALYAYGQSSGVNLPAVKLEGQKRALLPSHPDFVRLLIQRPTKPAIDIGAVLKRALRQVAEVEVGSPRGSPWVDLQVHFDRVGHGAKSAPSKVRKTFIKAAAMAQAAKPGTSKPMGASSWITGSSGAVAKWLDNTPCFEQVVVGKTGKMAMMRTLDPKAYVTVLTQVRNAVALTAPDDEAGLHVRFVEEMIGESMVVTKLDDVSQEALEKEVHAWLAANDSFNASISGGSGAQAKRPTARKPARSVV